MIADGPLQDSSLVWTVVETVSPEPRNNDASKKSGALRTCGSLIGDGTDWRRAIYHHTRLASDPNVSSEGNRPSWANPSRHPRRCDRQSHRHQ